MILIFRRKSAKPVSADGDESKFGNTSTTTNGDVIDLQYKRIIRDVCQVFKEVTGSAAAETKEGSSIVYWHRQHGFQTYDFRLLIEYEMSSSERREYYSQPGRLNIRHMFSPKRGDMLIDIVNDLRRAKELQKKAASLSALASPAPDVRVQNLFLRPGVVFQKKMIRVSEGKTFKWVWDQDNKAEYESLFTS